MNVVDNKKLLIPTRGRGRRLNTRTEKNWAENFANPESNGAFQRLPNRPNIKSSTMDTKTPAKTSQRLCTSSSARHSGRRKSSTPYNTGITGSSSSSRTATSLPVIIAITEGRGDARGEVGIAAVNVQHPHLILSQISDRHTYVKTLTKILVFKPVEIIMPETLIRKSGTAGKLFECIKEKFPTLNITAVSRQHFSNANGLDRIRNLCAQEYSSVELYVKQKFYALAAAAALLKYVEYTQNILYIQNSMKIEFHSSVDTTTIDIDSAESLELVTHQENSTKFTLLGVLDRCLTPGGKRYLRASILQPSCNERIIRDRQACVSEMVTDSTLFTSVQTLIKRLRDVDRLLVLGLNTPQKDNISSAEKNLNYAISLKTTLETIPFLQAALQTSQAHFFGRVLKNLEDPRFDMIMKIILEVLQPDTRYVAGFNSLTMQRCFALKSGLNDMLDIARQAYCELIDDMKGLVETLALKYDLPFTLACSASLGYHIQLDSPKQRQVKATDIPPVFIEVQKLKNSYIMTTEVLLVLSQRCKDACEELHLMSNVMLKGMLNAIREHIGCLYQLSNNISELDVIVSLASISSLSNYTRPVFGSRTELKNAMHPLMDITGTCVPVGNDVDVSPTHNFNIITGPNMGGKSVYLRQIVMLQIMSQIGCYVPAEKAQFRIADRIFCRICFGDSIECSASSFVLEIKETQYILQMVTPNSLIIMDELCRGTTVEEGESIAFAICEQLLNTSAFIFFTTHFLFLTKLAKWYPNVRNFHFETKCRSIEGLTEPRLIYTHKLLSGIMSTKNYGLALAETCGVPDLVVKMARGIAAKLSNEMKPTDIEREALDEESRNFYNEISLLHKQIGDGEFREEKVFEIVQRLCNSDISTPEGKVCNLDSEGVAGTTRSSMLSITEKFNRFKHKRLPHFSTSDSDFIPQNEVLEPKAVSNHMVRNSDPMGPSPSKKTMILNTSNSKTRLLDEPILPASGAIKSSSLTKIVPEREPGFINLKSLNFESQSINIPILPVSVNAETYPMNVPVISASYFKESSLARKIVSRESPGFSRMNTSNSETRTMNIPIMPANDSEESHAINFTSQQRSSLMRQSNSISRPQLVGACFSSGQQVEEREEKLYNSTGVSSPVSNRSPNPSIIDLISQLSTDTIQARMSAREKEAKIFREIEGEQFQESEFYGSIVSRNASSFSDIEDE